MKILFISNLYPPNVIGGYEELCCEVATAFAERGHEIAVLTSCYGGKLSEIPGQQIHQSLRLIVGETIYEAFSGSTGRRNAIKMQNAEALKRVTSDFKPDVIYCWNLFGLDPSFLDGLKELSVPTALMLTDNWLAWMLNPDFVGSYFRDCVLGTKAPQEWPYNGGFNLRLPAHVSAIFGANFVSSFYDAAGIKFSNRSVVHNGVKLQPENPSLETRSARDLTDTVRLLFAGRIVEIKGIVTAVDALANLLKRRPDIRWRLSIVGDTKDTAFIERLKQIGKDLDCGDAIDFKDRVSPDELPELFDSHDIYLFPSLYEPFSLTLIHALASGIPTVASTAGGNVEIVRDGETGLLFEKGHSDDMASAILRLVENPALRARVSTGASTIAQDFSSSKMIEEMETHLTAAWRRSRGS